MTVPILLGCDLRVTPLLLLIGGVMANPSGAKGASFETQLVQWLAQRLGDDRIERRTKNGTKDRGDVTGLKWFGHRVVVEAKNHKRMDLSGWVDEAAIEAGNDDAHIAAVVHKRRGKGAARFGETYVSMTLETFARLLEGGVV